jgi:hypothetical protein
MVVMFGLFNDDAEERIDELEDEVESLSDTVQLYQDKVDRLKGRVADAELRAEVNKLRVDVLSDQHLRKEYADFSELSDIYKDPTGQTYVLSKTRVAWKATENYIVKLLIPRGATVVFSRATFVKKINPDSRLEVRSDEAKSHKFRTNVAVVAEIETADGTYAPEYKDSSSHNPNFIYELGDVVEPEEPFDDSLKERCTSGIHFFPIREYAVDWLDE